MACLFSKHFCELYCALSVQLTLFDINYKISTTYLIIIQSVNFFISYHCFLVMQDARQPFPNVSLKEEDII